jgi:hypothetical protein
VDQPGDFYGGASAFIDDYFRLWVCQSAEENLQKVQTKDIQHIESGFAGGDPAPWRRNRNLSTLPERSANVTMDRKTIKPATTTKVLGVVFDQELRWKEHVQQAIKRATRSTSTWQDFDSTGQSKSGQLRSFWRGRQSIYPKYMGIRS